MDANQLWPETGRLLRESLPDLQPPELIGGNSFLKDRENWKIMAKLSYRLVN
jgi:hypothetical protein